jgi:hypothetical protein
MLPWYDLLSLRQHIQLRKIKHSERVKSTGSWRNSKFYSVYTKVEFNFSVQHIDNLSKRRMEMLYSILFF